MVLAYVLVGMVAGIVGFVSALALGASVWSALLTYSIVGAVALVLSPIVLLAIGTLGDWRWLDEVFTPAAEPKASDERISEDDRVSGGHSVDVLGTTSDDDALRGLRILAVDDDALVRDLLPKIAAEAGCPDITLANSGMQALEILATSSTSFDCLLLDINMPELDGIELCKRIRKIPAYRDIPIVMLTAMSDMDHIERAFRAGATDYTTKPFDIIAFGDRLQVAKAQLADRRAAEIAEVDNIGGRNDHLTPTINRLSHHSDITSLIKLDALQNYLMRLSGSALTNSYVMAVLVEPTSGAMFAGEVEDLGIVARAIDDAFSASGYLMAAVGPSEFVLVANAASLPNASAIESILQDWLNKHARTADRRAGQFAYITVGSGVRPGRSSSERARTAIESAVILAHNRAAAKREVFQGSNVRPLKR